MSAQPTVQSLIDEINQRVQDKILEQSNANLLIKLINNADSLEEAISIATLGTVYKKTGFHFTPKLEKQVIRFIILRKMRIFRFIPMTPSL